VRAASSEQDAAIFLPAAFTGLRRGELVGLRVRAVDFAGSVIRVEGSYAGGEFDDAEVRQARAGANGRRGRAGALAAARRPR
jgi:integrase